MSVSPPEFPRVNSSTIEEVQSRKTQNSYQRNMVAYKAATRKYKAHLERAMKATKEMNAHHQRDMAAYRLALKRYNASIKRSMAAKNI
jgi:uncharacterized protein YaiI (UPF0178 family)